MNVLNRSLAAVLIAAPVCAAVPAVADGTTLLTVSGSVSAPNRGAVDPANDKLFLFNEVRFDKAAAFDLDALRALPQVTLRTDFPMGGEEVEFSGPLLADVLREAGAEGEILSVQAMDGYAIEAPLDEITGKGAVVALERNGAPLGIGDYGPTQIVFPRGERADLAEMNDDWWIWQIYHIAVE